MIINKNLCIAFLSESVSMIVMKNILTILKPKKAGFILEQVRDPARYAREKTIAQSDDQASRLKLARNKKTHQEILYYMAENDPDPVVRQAVANNMATPLQTSHVMVSDPHEDVRLALASRLVSLLPELSKDDYAQLYAVAVQTLGALAKDEVVKIRMALSSALRNHAHAPPAVVAQLARDTERQVAEPILRFCTALEDDVLLDILKNSTEGWIFEAIASRGTVSEVISSAVIDKDHPPSGRMLIANPGSELGLNLLHDIVNRARYLPEWQEPLALRKGLPDEIADKMSHYAQESVRRLLNERSGLTRSMKRDVIGIVKRRLNLAKEHEAMIAVKRESPYDRAVNLAKDGKLDEAVIADALALHEEEFVVAALACMAKTSLSNVKYIFSLHAAKPIVTLSWRAGLSMRMALQLQQGLGRVPYQEIVYPRDGTDYPLTEEELRWQMDYLGLAA